MRKRVKTNRAEKAGRSKKTKTGIRSRKRRKSASRVNRGPVRIRNAEDPVVSVVIPVMNERRTLAEVIRQAANVHPQCEVIVVANGSKDGSAQLARRIGARVIAYDQSLGHDVGRAIGAAEARGQVLLFVDGDIPVRASELRPFVEAIGKGVDVALNRYLGPVRKSNVHSVILSKHALNWLVGRPDLSGTSMTTIPHALSRRALERIGPEQLAVPPKAQAAAIANGLRVEAVHYVEVGARNPGKRRRRGGGDPVEQLIVGDHLEALEHWVSLTTNRGNYEDGNRRRTAEEKEAAQGGESHEEEETR